MYAAFAVGCLAFLQLNRFQRLLFAQVGIAVPFYFLSHIVVFYQRSHGLPLNNLWVHNSYIPLECLLLCLAAYTRLLKSWERLLLLLLFLIFCLISLYDYLSTENTVWFEKSFYTESLLVVLTFAYLLYQTIHQFPGEWKFKGDFWMILGLLIYFAADSPYILMFNYLNTQSIELNDLLFNVINNFLANLRYLLLALGFWLAMREKENPLQS